MLPCVLIHPYPFVLDHLAPLAIQLNADILLFDEASKQMMEKFFPHTPYIYFDGLEKNLQTLFENYELIIHSMLTWSAFAIQLRKHFAKRMVRIVYAPHGNSDKRFWMQNDVFFHDVFLYYGDHMFDLLFENKSQRSIHTLIPIGNPRADYYERNKSFLQNLFRNEIAIDPSKKTLLFAPTWKSENEKNDFFPAAEKLIAELSIDFNVLVKLHPMLIENIPVESLLFLEFIKSTSNAHLLPNDLLMYPVLDFIDCFISDASSSIGYDFLYFDKPLYLYQPEEKSLLKGCSRTLLEKENFASQILNSYEEDLRAFSLKRKKLYDHCFKNEFEWFKHPLFLRSTADVDQCPSDNTAENPTYK